MIKTKTQFEKFPDNSRFSSLVDPLRMRYTAVCYIDADIVTRVYTTQLSY